MAARKRKGQTLVEVVVATMVAATVATAIFSVVLSSQVSTVRSDKREAAAMVIKAAQEQLKVYVSATPTDGNFVACSASPCTAANTGRWANDASGAWALNGSVGGVTHNISSLLTGMKQFDGMSPTLTYTVVNEDCGFGTSNELACKKVTFAMSFVD